MARRSMYLPALVAVVTLLTGLLAAPAPATAQAGPPARYSAPLEVTIDSLTPSYLPDRGPLRVTGTVTNVDDVPWAGVNLYGVLGDAPMVTSEELVAAAESDPLLVVGSRITDEGTYDQVGDLEPGETQRYSISIPRSLLVTNGAGVYWFGVHALGQSVDSVDDTVADGRARTFLPYVPGGTPGKVETALVLPLRRYLPYAENGSLDDLEGWTRSLSSGGRLGEMVDFGASAGSVPVTWLVDPALPDAVRRIAAGNPPRSLDPTVPPPGGDPEESPSGSPSPQAESEGEGREEPELTTEERAAADAATAWLDRLETAISGGEVLGLPYGDLDVAGAADEDPELYVTARERPSEVLTGWGITPTPAVAAPSGYLNTAGFELAEPGTTVLATDQMFGEDPPGVAEVAGKKVAVTSSGAASGGPGPGARFSTVQLRQRIVSEAAIHLLSPGRHPLVVLVPPEWNPTEASTFFSGLDVDWLDLTTVSDAIDRDGRTVEPDRLTYPDLQQRRQLDAASFDAVRSLISTGDTLQNLLSINDQVAAAVVDQGLAGASYAARSAPISVRQSLVRSRSWLSDRLESVTINAGPGVTLSSSDGGFATVITNRLDQPVTVNVAARSTGGIEIAPVEPIEIAPDSRATVVLEAHANQVGVHNVTLVLTDVEGNLLGSSDVVPIRSAQVSDVIWLIIGTGLGLLFLAILVRLVRRIRGVRRRGLEVDRTDDQGDQGDGAGPSAAEPPAPVGSAT